MKILNKQKVDSLNWRELQDLLQIVEQQVITLSQLLNDEKDTAFKRVYEDRIRKAKTSFTRLRELYNVTK